MEPTGRLYELNREKVAPDIAIISPAPVNSTLEIRGDKTVLSVNGKIKDKSKIKAFSINNEEVTISDRNGEYEFLYRDRCNRS